MLSENYNDPTGSKLTRLGYKKGQHDKESENESHDLISSITKKADVSYQKSGAKFLTCGNSGSQD